MEVGLIVEKVILNVEGMSCSHCQAAVEKALKSLVGVSAVTVDLEAKKAEVEYDSEKLTLASIKEAIEDEGYDVV